LPGRDHLPWGEDADQILDEIEEFLTGARHGPEPDRVLATVLFTDIVGATEKAAALGDRRWRDLLEGHHAIVRRELGRFRGREIDTAGDSFFATFDGPARAVRCARAVSDGVRALGLDVRAGLHTGEVEIVDDKVSGLAVHIGARVAATAGPGEVLVSSTVKDLVAGSGLRFQDHGLRTLKGVPGEWHLFALEAEGRRE
jgi:class 3 adenylate cyclase